MTGDESPGRHVRAAGERLDVQRLRVLPVDPVANAAQPREVAQVLRRGWSAGHLRDRATSRRSCLARLAALTEVGASAGGDDLHDRGSAPGARLARAAVDQELVLK